MSKEVLHDLCQMFKTRAENFGLKGKKREDAMMDFFTGATMALHATGQFNEYNHISSVTAMILSVRGYKEMEIILAETRPTDSTA